MKFFLLILLFPTVIQGQLKFPEYGVSLVYGNVSVSDPGKKPVAVKPFQLLFDNQSITLKKGAELTVMDNNRIFYELKNAGTYDISILKTKLTKAATPGPGMLYLYFLFDDFLNPNHSLDFGTFTRSHNAGSIAGSTRFGDCVDRIFPVDGIVISIDSIAFRWYKGKTNSVYSIFIGYEGDEKPVRFDIKDTLLAVNINKIGQGKRGKYSWIVSSAGDTLCNDYTSISNRPWTFTLLTKEDEQKMAELVIQGTEEKTFENKLQQVDKLEKAGLIYLASLEYTTLVNENPDNAILRRSYVMFLLTYGFYAEAKMIWR